MKTLELLSYVASMRLPHGGDYKLPKESEQILKEALDAWPYGRHEFDRVAVEKYAIPAASVARVRGVSYRSLGCYDHRVRNRYRHLMEGDQR